jgi:hypothetical protein
MASTNPIFEAPKDRQVLIEWKLFGSLVLYIDQRRSPNPTLRCFIQVNDRADVALLGTE